MNKKVNRLRRARKTRAKIASLNTVRLCVHKSNSHIYAQIISADGSTVLGQSSTVEPAFRADKKPGNTVEAAALIGKAIAEKAKGLGLERVAFDRSGFKYHGRIKALADAARENGLNF